MVLSGWTSRPPLAPVGLRWPPLCWYKLFKFQGQVTELTELSDFQQKKVTELTTKFNLLAKFRDFLPGGQNIS